MIRTFIQATSKTLLLTASLSAMMSCTMIEDNIDDCPTGLYVRFIYDYNTVQANGKTADLFKDHVGHVRLYVFDEDGQLVAQRYVSNTRSSAPLEEYGYTIHFPQQEVPAGHSYRLQAIAMDKDWDEALATEGAKYRIKADPKEHDDNLIVSLDHASSPVDGSDEYQVSDDAPLDIFWHTLQVIPHEPQDGRMVPAMDHSSKPFYNYPSQDQRVRVDAGKATWATVSMIRDTNHLTIGLHQTDPDEKKTISADQFEVKIVDSNCCVDHSNAVNTHHQLRYTPYAAWTLCTGADGKTEVETVHKGSLTGIAEDTRSFLTRAEDDEVVERQAHYNMMFNRLMINDDNDEADNAALVITRKDDGKEVAHVNLPHYLSMGRDAYALSNYSHQEYLDREYDYHLDFFLQGGKWIALEIHVLSWSKRIQNISL